MWKESVCSFKGMWLTAFSIQKGILRKGGSHKQEHGETQTSQTSDKGGRDEYKPGQPH